MSGRHVSLGAVAALIVGLAGAIVVACYDLPTPDCGFVCGPANACPDDYTCADDHYCHRMGAPADLVCATPDAALPLDAAPDGIPDAIPDAMPDAMSDAMTDAGPDVVTDAAVTPDAAADAAAPPDAAADAATDAAIDAQPDAAVVPIDAPDATPTP